MTELLAQAFERASALPESVQNLVAQQLLDEIESDAHWDQALAGSQDKLERLADKALKEYEAGKTTEMGFDEL